MGPDWSADENAAGPLDKAWARGGFRVATVCSGPGFVLIVGTSRQQRDRRRLPKLCPLQGWQDGVAMFATSVPHHKTATTMDLYYGFMGMYI